MLFINSLWITFSTGCGPLIVLPDEIIWHGVTAVAPLQLGDAVYTQDSLRLSCATCHRSCLEPVRFR
jgi:hypothetical protein